MHDRPSGDPTPPGADIRMTRELVDIAEPLGIAIHDHIIVGRDGHASFKGAGADLPAAPTPARDAPQTCPGNRQAPPKCLATDLFPNGFEWA